MRRLLSCVLCMALVLAALPARAAGGPVNPYREAAMRVQEQGGLRILLRALLSSSFEVETLTTPTLDTPGVWQVIPPDEGQYTYQYWIADVSDLNNPQTWYYQKEPTADPVYTRQLVAPGRYMLYVTATDVSSGESVWVYGPRFRVREDGIHPTIDEVVQQAAEACLASGASDDYEKARFLHDWLLSRAAYDNTYTFYGPDGVLLLGTGVCDSYTLAYGRLLEAVGIQQHRVSNSGHAWNAALLDGSWVYIDSTWDDTGGGDTFSTHRYLGITTELLDYQHGQPYSPAVDAVTLAENDVVRQRSLPEMLSDLKNSAQARLDAGELRFSLPADAPVTLTENGAAVTVYGEGPLAYAPLTWLLQSEEWQTAGQALTGEITYDLGSELISFEMAPDPNAEPITTPTDVSTEEPTDSPTATPTSTPAQTEITTPTDLPTPSSTPTATPTVTPAPTGTPTPTPTAAQTPTVTLQPSAEPTIITTNTDIETEIPVPTPTATATPTPTATATLTPTPTPTALATPTATATPTPTATATSTPTASPMATPAVTTPKPTRTPGPTRRPTPTPTRTPVPTPRPTRVPTPTRRPTPTPTRTPVPTPRPTSVPTPTRRPTPTPTPTARPTREPVRTPMSTTQPTPTKTPVLPPVETLVPTITPTIPDSTIGIPTWTPSATMTWATVPPVDLNRDEQANLGDALLLLRKLCGEEEVLSDREADINSDHQVRLNDLVLLLKLLRLRFAPM